MKQPIGPILPGTRQVLLTFPDVGGNERDFDGHRVVRFCEQVQLPFLPKGLVIWGATTDTLVHGVKVGNMTEVEIGGYAPIPGLYFQQGRTFEELQLLADVGELERGFEVRQQLEMHEAAPGTQITVALSGPYDRFCVWGSTYIDGRPHRRATIGKAQQSEQFTGQLDEVTLGGVRTVLEVTAPDAKTAADLLVGLYAPVGSRW